ALTWRRPIAASTRWKIIRARPRSRTRSASRPRRTSSWGSRNSRMTRRACCGRIFRTAATSRKSTQSRRRNQSSACPPLALWSLPTSCLRAVQGRTNVARSRMLRATDLSASLHVTSRGEGELVRANAPPPSPCPPPQGGRGSWFALTRDFLYGFFAALAGPYPHHLLDGADEYLAVADLAGPCRRRDGLDAAVHLIVGHHHFDLHLGQKIDHVFGAAVELGMTLLPAEAFHFRDGETGHPRLGQGLADIVELERLYDRFDFFHCVSHLKPKSREHYLSAGAPPPRHVRPNPEVIG